MPKGGDPIFENEVFCHEFSLFEIILVA